MAMELVRDVGDKTAYHFSRNWQLQCLHDKNNRKFTDGPDGWLYIMIIVTIPAWIVFFTIIIIFSSTVYLLGRYNSSQYFVNNMPRLRTSTGVNHFTKFESVLFLREF